MNRILLIGLMLFSLSCKKDDPTSPAPTPPSVTITSPLNNSTVVDSVTITTDIENIQSIEKVEFYLDETLANTRSSPPWTFHWSVQSLSIASIHTIVVKAYDQSSAITSSKSIVVSVNRSDQVPPTVVIQSPIIGAEVLDSGLVVVSATDNVGIQQVQFLVDDNLVHVSTTPPWSFEWSVAALPPKTIHVLTARAYDPSNNVGVSEGVSVTVNRNQAIHLNGSTDFISLTSTPSLTSFGNQITVEAWIRLAALVDLYGYGPCIVASGNQNEFAFSLWPDGRLGATMVMVNHMPNSVLMSKSALTTNTWYHVAFTYNGSTESILINGVVDTTISASGMVSSTQYTENLSIGAYTWNITQHSDFFNGEIDELRIWDIARTQAQLGYAMNSRLSGNETGLVGYWRFDGDITDKSAGVNVGTSHGSPTFDTIGGH